MSRNFFHYLQASYTGGQNDSDEPEMIKDDQAVLIKNGITDSIGLLKQRNGCVLVGDESAGTEGVTGLFTFIPDSGTIKELRIAGTALQYNNSGTWTNIDTGFTTGLDTWFTQINNKVYISNGTENTHSYDGTTVSDLGTSYPKAKYTASWKNYLFIAGEGYIGGTKYKNRVWFSNLGDPDTVTTASDYFDVGKSDGQEITGIWPLGEFLVIFKRRSIFILTGNSPDEWKLSASINNLVNIANSIGCVSAKSIVQVGNDLWFMSDDGIRSIKKNEQGAVPLMGQVSSNINTTIDSINKGAYNKICGTYFDNKVYMAIPTGSSTENDVVMVANTRINIDNATNPYPWFTYTGWPVSCMNVHLSSGVAELHFGSHATNNIYQGETGNTDAIGEIEFEYIGKLIDGGQPEMKKTFRFIKYGALGGGNYYIDFSVSVDGTTYVYVDHLLMKQGTEWDTGVWGTDVWSSLGEIKDKIAIRIGSPQLQVKFSHTGNNEPITLYPYTLAIKRRKIK
jgi:hypothetical protein